jgi:hypothetical protein
MALQPVPRRPRSPGTGRWPRRRRTWRATPAPDHSTVRGPPRRLRRRTAAPKDAAPERCRRCWRHGGGRYWSQSCSDRGRAIPTARPFLEWVVPARRSRLGPEDCARRSRFDSEFNQLFRRRRRLGVIADVPVDARARPGPGTTRERTAPASSWPAVGRDEGARHRHLRSPVPPGRLHDRCVDYRRIGGRGRLARSHLLSGELCFACRCL